MARTVWVNGVGVCVLNVFEQWFDGDDLTGAGHEVPQDTELLAGEGQRDTATVHQMTGRVEFDDGTTLVETASSDMGPSTCTSMTEVAAVTLGLTLETVQLRSARLCLPAHSHVGSMTMASIGTAVLNSRNTVRC